MSSKSYFEKLKDPRWQKKRLEIFKRDEFRCVLCYSSEKELNVHHLEYGKEPWSVDNGSLITVCKDCHEKIKLFDRLLIPLKITAYKNFLLFGEENYEYCASNIIKHVNMATFDGPFEPPIDDMKEVIESILTQLCAIAKYHGAK